MVHTTSCVRAAQIAGESPHAVGCAWREPGDRPQRKRGSQHRHRSHCPATPPMDRHDSSRARGGHQLRLLIGDACRWHGGVSSGQLRTPPFRHSSWESGGRGDRTTILAWFDETLRPSLECALPMCILRDDFPCRPTSRPHRQFHQSGVSVGSRDRSEATLTTAGCRTGGDQVSNPLSGLGGAAWKQE